MDNITDFNTSTNNKIKKTGAVMLISMVIGLFVGIVGIAFGIYELIQLNNFKVEQQEEISNNSQQEPDANLIAIANAILKPYLKRLFVDYDVFDYELTDDVRIALAFNGAYSGAEIHDIIAYDKYTMSLVDLQQELTKLFGDTITLEKKEYSLTKDNRTQKTFSYSADGSFNMLIEPAGGTGRSTISVAKNAYFENGSLVIEVYHDTLVSWCDSEADAYCIEESDDSGTIPYHTTMDESVREFIKKNGSSIPVYKATFSLENNRFILSSIQKQ